ncbi:MAG: hypothetical protein DHS20C18_46130 [Saprospiraceae bacterium]|nr:MAG: hypothetical protein DHS20C18_46130 [Saprospiraceae bacterium]
MSCGRERYQTAGYETLSQKHQVLAILPVETIMTGRIPRELSREDIDQIEEAESKAFQISLFTELSRGSGNRYNDIRVNFQHYETTNDQLAEAGIGFREAWTMSPTKLAEILGVDAVVKTTIEKQQYLTDLESFGIELAATITGIFMPGSPFFHFARNRTSDVWASCTVLDSETGVSVWSTRQKCPTYWNQPTRDVVNKISRTLCRRFPYRNN